MEKVGGRGLKTSRNFKMIEKLTGKLDAAVKALRGVVVAGYISNELQSETKHARGNSRMNEPLVARSCLFGLMLVWKSFSDIEVRDALLCIEKLFFVLLKVLVPTLVICIIVALGSCHSYADLKVFFLLFF
ncbi:uncharacterized protein [Spinacia oleracea]|uniref:Uncharacterized protein isoform X1 n=1 Tax=Spinacia oleracea TaxID=3562 RepID=A0ABM3RES9_SPIOL|nr:uncharacterized protein LOC130469187 isoform X1 [Spinacia oleracea]XP_056694118.1 uncharacterized protein LOC130469187 isoform X1 [Spinacia oleracea]